MSPLRHATPNTPPNLTNLEPTAAERLGSTAVFGLSGYAIHRGLSPEALRGTAGEASSLLLIPASLSVNGLRAKIIDRRIEFAKTGEERAETAAKKTTKRAQQREANFQRVILGRSVPHDHPFVETEVEDIEGNITKRLVHNPDGTLKIDPENVHGPTLTDKAEAAVRKVRSPRRKRKSSDSFSATRHWLDERADIKMVRKRNKRRKFEMEADTQRRWFGRDMEYQGNQARIPLAETSDLGTPLGWNRLFQTPRTGQEVRGYRRANELMHHAEHKAHRITEKAHKKVEKTKAKVEKYERKRTKREEKTTKLEQRKTAIANREDRVSKFYDSRKAGFKAAPAAFREGQQGINVPDSRTQKVLNATARGAGLALGTAKREYKPSNIKRSVQRDMESIRAWRASRAAEAGRQSKAERKRQKQAEKAQRQAQNKRGVV